MCGIAGKLCHDPFASVAPDDIDAMLATINHRGPDGRGTHLEGPAGLGHVRLSIIDLASGAQPLANEDGTVWIAFNGEIYNYLELRETLQQRGHTFRTKSDTEVIVHAYEEYGPACVSKLRGMFAFAIWDHPRRRLFLARDRVGIKPLYYSVTPDALYFASEIKAILTQADVKRDLSMPALRQFLSFYFAAGDDTLFESVKKLPPGHYLVAEPGKHEIRQYWDLAFTQERWERPFDDLVEELRHLLAETVRCHMIADVPVGVLLSGGVDSSAILAYAVRETQRQVKTFTVGFEGAGVVDERPYAQLAAQRMGSEHHDLSISAEDFWAFLPAYVRHMEEPVCEPPAVALYYVSRMARAHAKVLLSGEGGDEAFAGYPNYPNMLRLDGIARRLGPGASPAGWLMRTVGSVLRHERLQRYGFALGSRLEDHYLSRTSGPTTFFNRPSALYAAALADRARGADASRHVGNLLAAVRSQPLLNRMLYVDTKTWLPDDLLIKADKITMANSLELRVPLLDHQVLEFAASLPPETKVKGKSTKRILKAALEECVPPEVLTRKKAGFPVPYESWLRHTFATDIRDILLSQQAVSRGYFQKAGVENVLTTHAKTGRLSKEVFSMLVLELWHREFVDAPRRAHSLAAV